MLDIYHVHMTKCADFMHKVWHSFWRCIAQGVPFDNQGVLISGVSNHKDSRYMYTYTL